MPVARHRQDLLSGSSRLWLRTWGFGNAAPKVGNAESETGATLVLRNKCGWDDSIHFGTVGGVATTRSLPAPAANILLAGRSFLHSFHRQMDAA